MDAFTLYRIANKLYRAGVPVFPKLIQLLILFLFNSYIPYQARIAKTAKIGHRGIGVVINKDASIGERVLVRAHVTIGKKTSDGKAPVIGDDVVLGDGCKVLGDVEIGDGAVVGANAVVVKSVPAGHIAVGIPARVKAPAGSE